MDLESKILVVQALVQDLKSEQQRESVEVCLNAVLEIVEKVLHGLSELHTELDYHQTRWFNTWRTPNVEPLLKGLCVLDKIFDKRVDLLIKILSATRD